ncbi:hypothetical protein [Vibrio owensii]|uniref:hypothetical protein n=1 Tax=Vibrio owensii TaxID=696485 RepID=UPI0018F1A3BC|nr:hypothetical protein [Vibrio owensii]
MVDFTDYMGVWYKALLMFALLIFGGAAVSYLILGGEYSSHIRGSSLAALIVAFIAYRQKTKKRG